MLLLKTILLTAAAIEVADLDRAAQELQNENMILKKRVSNLKLAKENKELLAEIEALELESSKVMKTEDTAKANGCWDMLFLFDADGSGTIEEKEWMEIFDALDKDKGGKLDDGELGPCWDCISTFADGKDGIKVADGIDKDEWKKILGLLDTDSPPGLEEKEIDAVCSSVARLSCSDKVFLFDFDGSGEIDEGEWMKIFDALDKPNAAGVKDGKLSPEELGSCSCLSTFAKSKGITGDIKKPEWRKILGFLDANNNGLEKHEMPAACA